VLRPSSVSETIAKEAVEGNANSLV
jgi:hypothetical protein